jgi:hypothetical protein
VQRISVGALFFDNMHIDTLASGLYAIWKGPAEASLAEVDLCEAMLDIGGQEIMAGHVAMILIRPRLALLQ